MKLFRWPGLWLGTTLLWLATAGLASVHAGGEREHEHSGQRDHQRDHDRARAALQAGEVLPLQKVLDQVQRSHPGEVLEVELEHEEGRWVYELKLLQTGGRLIRLDVDAKTAQVLRSRPRQLPPAGARP